MVLVTSQSSNEQCFEIMEKTGVLVVDSNTSVGVLDVYAELVQALSLPYLAITPADSEDRIALAFNSYRMNPALSPDRYTQLVKCLLKHGAIVVEDFAAQKEREESGYVLTAELPRTVDLVELIRDMRAAIGPLANVEFAS